MVSSAETNSSVALKMVSSALEDDSQVCSLSDCSDFSQLKQFESVYSQYVLCVNFIGKCLLDDAQPTFMLTEGSLKLVSLAQRCMDRLEYLGKRIIDNKKYNQEDIWKVAKHEGDAAITKRESNTRMSNSPDSLTKSIAASEISMKERTESLNSPVPKVDHIAHAYKQNVKVKQGFLLRLAKARDAQTAATLRLTLERRLHENMLLARKKQKVYEKDLAQRRKELDYIAVQKISVNSLQASDSIAFYDEKVKLYAKVLEYEQDVNKEVGRLSNLLKEQKEDTRNLKYFLETVCRLKEHPIYQVIVREQYKIFRRIHPLVMRYLSILDNINKECIHCTDSNQSSVMQTGENITFLEESIEKQHNLVVQWREDTVRNIEEALAEGEQIRHNLSEFNNDLPSLGSYEEREVDFLVTEFEELLCDNVHSDESEKVQILEEEALERHLQNVIHDIESALNKLDCLVLCVYDVISDIDGGEEFSHIKLEDQFFEPLWPSLCALFRLTLRSSESRLFRVMMLSKTVDCTEFGVTGNLLIPTGELGIFQPTLNTLSNVQNCRCPSSLLSCFVSTCEIIAKIASASEHSMERAVGADELLPLLSYCIAHSNLPILITLSRMVEAFVTHEKRLQGEEGYCLATFQMALDYVMKLDS